MKKYLPYIISAAMLIAGFLLMTKCESKPDPIDNTSLIGLQSAKINRLLLQLSTNKIDTLIKIKKVYKTKYDTTFVEVVRLAPDTCNFYLTKLNKECLKVDSANNAIISEQETQMIKYSEVVGLMQERNLEQEKRHVNDSTTIHKLDRKLKRTRKLAFAGIGAAFIGGLIIK
jgi:hypothetical protein